MSKKMNSLEDYDVISVIGTGTFGTCYKVRDKTTFEIYAWKAIDCDGEFNDVKKESLSCEIDLLRQLNHPNIVQYFNHILNYDTKMIFIIMEYCAGGDLANLVLKCNREHLKFEEKYIWRVLQQLCKALQFCQNKITNGIILHRDIKPANVFLDINGNAKLGDFGLARKLHRNCDEFAETLVGTPYYMSPEIVRGRKYNHKSDIWAVGCLIYEMSSLKPPFKGRIFHQLSKNITNGQFSCIPEFYSKDLQAIITFMLEVDSEYRPSVEMILRHPILIRNITDLINEYPCLISSEPLNRPKKLNFSPNLSSTILTHFSNMDESNDGRISGVNTPTLRAELFGTIKRNILTNSNPELNKTCNTKDDKIVENNNTNYLINYCPDDPEILTRNIFDAELKRRLQTIRAQESLLKQKAANLLAREKQLNEREIRISETEKQLTERKLQVDELLKQSTGNRLKNLPKRPVLKSFDDTYCSIEPNDTIVEPTVAKLNLALLPAPKLFSRKTVTFNSPKKFIKYNIENIPPSQQIKITKSSSLRIDSNSQNNKKDLKLNNFSSSLSTKSTLSEDSEHSSKRKSILSIFGINTNNKSSLKDNKKSIKSGNNKVNDDNIVTNKINEKKEILQKIETTNLAKCWTSENKRAAFELLAAMNAAADRNAVNVTESNENNINKLKQNWRKSTREKTVLQRTKQRRSMMILSDNKNILI